jgi:hypothetical protein
VISRDEINRRRRVKRAEMAAAGNPEWKTEYTINYMREWRKRNPKKLKAWRRSHYLRNKKKVIAQTVAYYNKNFKRMRAYRTKWNRQYQPTKRAVVREFYNKLKDVPCADCGNRFPPCAMDFDHVRGKKEHNMGSLGNRLSIRQIKKEAKKCDVVCACCHRIRTYITRKKKY